MATRDGVLTMAGVDAAARAGVRVSGLHLYACLTVAATLFLIFAGGLVTSTGSGLAVPDWPLSFGQVMPEMRGGVFYEHGHRLVASGVGLLTIGLVVWAYRARARLAIRRMTLLALIAVVVQGALGGLTVLLRLPPQVSVLHACLAQGFLCLVVAIAVVTGPGWRARAGIARAPLHRLAVAAAAAIYAQLIAGAIMRHTGAGLAIRDFPLAMGKIIPPLESAGVRIHFLHRVMAVVILLLVAAVVARALASRGAWLRGPAVALAALAAVQIALGGLTVLSGRQPHLTSLHVVGGAAVLTAAVILALRSARGAGEAV